MELLLFADDTSNFYSDSNPNTLESVLNNDFLKYRNLAAMQQIVGKCKENDLSHF